MVGFERRFHEVVCSVLSPGDVRRFMVTLCDAAQLGYHHVAAVRDARDVAEFVTLHGVVAEAIRALRTLRPRHPDVVALGRLVPAETRGVEEVRPWFSVDGVFEVPPPLDDEEETRRAAWLAASLCTHEASRFFLYYAPDHAAPNADPDGYRGALWESVHRLLGGGGVTPPPVIDRHRVLLRIVARLRSQQGDQPAYLGFLLWLHAFRAAAAVSVLPLWFHAPRVAELAEAEGQPTIADTMRLLFAASVVEVRLRPPGERPPDWARQERSLRDLALSALQEVGQRAGISSLGLEYQGLARAWACQLADGRPERPDGEVSDWSLEQRLLAHFSGAVHGEERVTLARAFRDTQRMFGSRAWPDGAARVLGNRFLFAPVFRSYYAHVLTPPGPVPAVTEAP